MPDLDKLPVPQYAGNQPYHAEYDNLPLATLADRDELINGQSDSIARIIVDCAGTQGTLSQRLAESINPDGSLIVESIDATLHSIVEHADGSKTVSDDDLTAYINLGFPELENPVSFVRMLQSEREKLALIANDATNMTIEVETPSNIILFEQGPVSFASSESIVWEVTAPNTIKAALVVSTDFAHRHYYDLEPVEEVAYTEYKVTSVATPFIEDSLRVYINGIRISSEVDVYYPSNPVSTWAVNKFTPDAENGTFILDNSITADDIIRIDFDVSLT